MRQSILYTGSPARVVTRYNQGTTAYCLFNAFAGQISWNCGDIMTDSAILRMADRIKPGKPHLVIPKIHAEVEKYYEMHAIREDWKPYLKKGWGILVYLRPTRSFWLDVSDGKLDTEKLPGDGMDHEGWIHEVDGNIIFENSWKSLQSFDITGKVEEMRSSGLMPGMGYIFTKK